MQTQPIQTPAHTENHQKLVGELIMSMMGVDRLAYIKECATDGDFTVFAADGTPLTSFESRDEAFYSIRKHNLMPVQIH